jgi:hypothetical protein
MVRSSNGSSSAWGPMNAQTGAMSSVTLAERPVSNQSARAAGGCWRKMRLP